MNALEIVDRTLFPALDTVPEIPLHTEEIKLEIDDQVIFQMLCMVLSAAEIAEDTVVVAPWIEETIADQMALTVVPRFVKNVAIGVTTFAPIHVATDPTAAQAASQRPIQKFLNSSDVFHRVMKIVTNAMTAVMIAPIGLAIMAALRARNAVAAAVTTALSVGMIEIIVPIIDNTGPIAARMPAITKIACCAGAGSDESQLPNAVATSATMLAILSNGSPNGSKDP